MSNRPATEAPTLGVAYADASEPLSRQTIRGTILAFLVWLAWSVTYAFYPSPYRVTVFLGEPSPRDLQLMTNNLSGKGEWINHNRATVDETARFLWLIAADRIATPEACAEMRKLMERKKDRKRSAGTRKIFQDRLPVGSIVWSKSGYTSQTSHDAAIRGRLTKMASLT